MTSRSQFILLAFILTLVGASAVAYITKTQRAQPTSYADCVQKNGAILESYPEQCVLNGVTFSNPNQQAPTLPDTSNNNSGNNTNNNTSNTGTYTDDTNGYSFKYPTNIFVKADESVLLPYTNDISRKPGIALTHTINAEHCDLAGNCTPTTTDLKITAVVIDLSVNQINQSKIGPLKASPDGPTGTKYVEQGAEGEGIFYYFIPLTQTKTLMISRTYLDENTLFTYKTVPNFIPLARQAQITKELLNSITVK